MTQPSNNKTLVFHEFQGNGFYLAQFKTAQLSIFSYYVESQGQAYLIDPTYEIYPYQQLAQKRKSKIISILLTHYHADYVSGHTELDLPIILGPNSKKQGSLFKVYQMQDSSTFNLGSSWFKIIHTPGHTLQSTCFLLSDKDHKQTCLFTGDTIFLGEVGRPDLAVCSTVSSQDLASMLYNSLQKIKKEVDVSVRIYPTHGAGSSCGKNISNGNFCTLQTQIATNYALKIDNEKELVDKILFQMPKAPSYFFHDAMLNQTGKSHKFSEQMKKSCKALTIEEFKSEITKGSTVLDVRHDFGGKTIKNSLLMSENGMLLTWIGNFVEPDTSLLIICNKESISDIVERILRIGYSNIKGFNGFTIDEWKQKGNQIWEPKLITAKQSAETPNKINLDVRNLPEWKGGIIEGSKLIPLAEILKRADQVSGLENIQINCRTSMRATLACSLLAQKGIQSSVIYEKIENFEKGGIKIVEYK